jgi:hypothetical protein
LRAAVDLFLAVRPLNECAAAPSRATSRLLACHRTGLAVQRMGIRVAFPSRAAVFLMRPHSPPPVLGQPHAAGSGHLDPVGLGGQPRSPSGPFLREIFRDPLSSHTPTNCRSAAWASRMWRPLSLPTQSDELLTRFFLCGNTSLMPSPYHRRCARRASHRLAHRMPSRAYFFSEAPRTPQVRHPQFSILGPRPS